MWTQEQCNLCQLTAFPYLQCYVQLIWPRVIRICKDPYLNYFLASTSSADIPVCWLFFLSSSRTFPLDLSIQVDLYLVTIVNLHCSVLNFSLVLINSLETSRGQSSQTQPVVKTPKMKQVRWRSSFPAIVSSRGWLRLYEVLSRVQITMKTEY